MYIEVEGKFKNMLSYAQLQEKQNANPKRRPYDLFKNSCIHFVKDVVRIAGVETPWMIDSRPNSYIEEFRAALPDLDYLLRTDSLKIEGVGSR